MRFMKKTNPKATARKTTKAAKAHAKTKVKTPKLHRTPRATAVHKKPLRAKASSTAKAIAAGGRKPPVSIGTARHKGGDSDRGLYVRFTSVAIKNLVKAAAEEQKASMNGYIVAATLDWVERKVALPTAAEPEPTAAAG
jgi:hypothetical protein